MNALATIGVMAKKWGMTLGTSSYYLFKTSTLNVGISDAISLLYYKYVNNLYVSYKGIDYSVLAHLLYRLGRQSDLAYLGLSSLGDFVYTNSTGNSTIIYSDPNRVMNVGSF